MILGILVLVLIIVGIWKPLIHLIFFIIVAVGLVLTIATGGSLSTPNIIGVIVAIVCLIHYVSSRNKISSSDTSICTAVMHSSTEETKKCEKCGERVNADKFKCPKCGGESFS
jgi:predicted RNA-binding Zn-ribbon protein involved in translation (DUF1610 family)